MPDAKLVFGLWSLEDKPRLAEQRREAAGAGYVVAKLEDAVSLSLREAGQRRRWRFSCHGSGRGAVAAAQRCMTADLAEA
jgi:hypothetical protein